MANSLVSSIPISRAVPIQKDVAQTGKKTVELDIIIDASKNNGFENKQSSLTKIANFKPTQLKNFSNNIKRTLEKNKRAAQIKDAQQALIMDKVKRFRKNDPLKKKSVAETQVGSKIDLST